MKDHVLILNASYEFLNIASLHRAVKLLFKGKAEVVEYHPQWEIRSSVHQMKYPLIIRMRYYITRPYYAVPLTKKNILIRDDYTCQYCGDTGNTVDHILPRSRGGQSSWENCVCACSYCNTRKKDLTLRESGMKLMREPKRLKYPLWIEMKNRKSMDAWQKYL